METRSFSNCVVCGEKSEVFNAVFIFHTYFFSKLRVNVKIIHNVITVLLKIHATPKQKSVKVVLDLMNQLVQDVF